jgi:hypothetical protein
MAANPQITFPQLERIIGLGYFRIQAEAVKNKMLLALAQERYDTYRSTWSISLMGLNSVRSFQRPIFWM